MRSIVVVSLALGLVLAGCGDDTPDPTLSPVPLDTGTGTPAPSETATDVPGEPFGRAVADATYHVVGVAHEDTLNVRSGPGVDYDVLTEVGPTGSAVATGDDRLLDSGLWLELTVDGVSGWANYSFLAMVGGTFDITADVVSENGGDLPVAETMEDLGLLVADFRKSTEPASRIEIVVAPTVGDLGEITVDVVGLGDDALKGERLVVFGTPDGEGFVLHSVEATLLCDRGVDGDACV